LAIIIALGFYPAPLLNVINPVAAQVIESQGFADPVPSESAGK
jgi:NADH-quinone oxidoreductase subunit M